MPRIQPMDIPMFIDVKRTRLTTAVPFCADVKLGAGMPIFEAHFSIMPASGLRLKDAILL
jgi:hypothetical protein